MPKGYEIHIEEDGRSKPRPHELRVAKILAEYFKSDVVFLRRYASKTPDLYVLKINICWEIKSPEGNTKHTIKNNLRIANRQSENIILDLSRTKMTKEQAVARSKEFVRSEHSKIKRLKIVTKQGKVVDIIG